MDIKERTLAYENAIKKAKTETTPALFSNKSPNTTLFSHGPHLEIAFQEWTTKRTHH